MPKTKKPCNSYITWLFLIYMTPWGFEPQFTDRKSVVLDQARRWGHARAFSRQLTMALNKKPTLLFLIKALFHSLLFQKHSVSFR